MLQVALRYYYSEWRLQARGFFKLWALENDSYGNEQTALHRNENEFLQSRKHVISIFPVQKTHDTNEGLSIPYQSCVSYFQAFYFSIH